MPAEVMSSVLVVSTHLAHRRQRNTSTEATGWVSIVVVREQSPTEDEQELDDEEVEEELE